jgi:hypothetical protein
MELLHGGVRGAELEKRDQSSPKHALNTARRLQKEEHKVQIVVFDSSFMRN